MSLALLQKKAMENVLVTYGAFLLVGLGIYYLRYARKSTALRLPPGPSPLPIVGNVTDLPPKGVPEYKHWFKHKDLYGPISSVSVMGQTLIVLHDRDLANEILEKSSLKTAERPVTEMTSQLREYSTIIPNFAYNDDLRRCRKLIHQQIGTRKLVGRFHDTLELEARKFLLRTLEKPENLEDYVKLESSAGILRMTYGYSAKTDGSDPLVTLIENVLEQLIKSLTPGTWLVDIFPMLKYLPKGSPGTGFRKAVRNLTADFATVENIPFNFVQEQMNNATHRHSYVSGLIQESGGSPSSQLTGDIKSTAAAMYGAAVETTSSTTMMFILAMIKFPEIQRKAQEEIDRVVGSDRLPGFDDQQNLPYVNALITEALRWFPALPMGFPHMASQDITAQGYLIPKNSIILPSVYWFTHDPKVHPNPELFDPERFLEPRNELNPRQIVFGYGRRICPGRYFADDALFLNISQTLATFNITNAVDERGFKIEPELDVVPGVATHPKPFPYKIEPRSPKHAKLIREMARDLPQEKDDFAQLGHFKASG